MTAYIVDIAKGIVALSHETEPNKWRAIVHHVSFLVDEMKRLDPRDFLPASRYAFVVARLDLAAWNERWTRDMGDFLDSYMSKPHGKKEVQELMERIIAVLEKYGGEGWRAQTRTFSFIRDEELRAIIERDYKELTLVLFPGGAWKSTVIMAGSILEAMLFDLLGCDPAMEARAIASPVAPRKKSKIVPLKDWKLESLLRVVVDLNILPADRGRTFDQVLRDYRNFVHPNREIKAAHPCGEGEAQLAIGGLNAVCDILQPQRQMPPVPGEGVVP